MLGRICKVRIFAFPAVFRIGDVYVGSECFQSRIQVRKIPDPDPHQGILSIFNTNKLFPSSRKNDLGCSSRILDPDPDLSSIPDPDPGPGIKKASDPESPQHCFFRKPKKVIHPELNPKDARAEPRLQPHRLRVHGRQVLRRLSHQPGLSWSFHQCIALLLYQHISESRPAVSC
jgi:hypothetical protein